MQQRNIRSVADLIRSLPDWTEFNECFAPSRIRISDVDGIVERKGEVLMFEVKRISATVPTGQVILYRTLARKGITVLVIHADMINDVPSERLKSGDEAMIAGLRPMLVQRVQTYHPDGSTVDESMNNDGLRQRIREWYLRANRKHTYR
jgi:hypothetical protein